MSRIVDLANIPLNPGEGNNAVSRRIWHTEIWSWGGHFDSSQEGDGMGWDGMAKLVDVYIAHSLLTGETRDLSWHSQDGISEFVG